jgi:hypothetical protein
MKYFFPYNIYSKEILLCINFSVWNLFYGIYFFRCNGNFIIHMEKILHEIDSIWKNYYIIKFPWNKYYAGTNISSQNIAKVLFFTDYNFRCFWFTNLYAGNVFNFFISLCNKNRFSITLNFVIFFQIF